MGNDLIFWLRLKRAPCVELAFFNDGKKVAESQVWPGGIIPPSICGNPKLEVAVPMCGSSTQAEGKIECHYHGERVTYATAEAMCTEAGRVPTHPTLLKWPRAGVCADGVQDVRFRWWANAWCKVHVKIDLGTGYIAIVNEVEPDSSENATATVLDHVSPDTVYFFKSAWGANGAPSSLSDCVAISSCYVHDEYCICATDATESAVYSSDLEVSSIDQLMASLHIGGVDPAAFDAGTYTSLSCSIPGVAVYSTSGSCSELNADTIFAFEWKSKPLFLANKKSTVHILDSAYSFRNPVHFISLADPEARVSPSDAVTSFITLSSRND